MQLGQVLAVCGSGLADPSGARWALGDDGDRRIGPDFRLEGIDAVHIDVVNQVEAIGHLASQGPSVLVLHPRVRADEGQAPVRLEEIKGLLEEGHIEVRAPHHRGVAAAVVGEGVVVDVLLAHVRGVADDEVEATCDASGQEVIVDKPRIGQKTGIRWPEARGCQRRDKFEPEL